MAADLALVSSVVEPSVPQSAIASALADYRRQRDEWDAQREKATVQIVAIDGAIQACEALLTGLAKEAAHA